MSKLFSIFTMTLPAIFSILNNVSIGLSKFSKVHKGKQTSLLAKVNSRCFSPISGRHVCVPQKGTNMASPY